MSSRMRIHYGSIFESTKPYLVNPVNCCGVMGAGLALQFKQRFPAMFEYYQNACRTGDLIPGRPVLWTVGPSAPGIVLFPTKQHWRNPSKMTDIIIGLMFYNEFMGFEAAFPLLGAGLGGLDPDEVLAVLETFLDDRCEVRMPARPS